MFKFDMGEEVKDKITGFAGVIVCRSEYLTGCRRYALQTKKMKDGKPQDWQTFDEDQLVPLKKKASIPIHNPGGPQQNDRMLQRR